MIGARPLTYDEVAALLQELRSPRDRCLLVLGICTGFRISELLSLTWNDVIKYDEIVDRIHVQRKNMKGKMRSRSAPLRPEAKDALAHYRNQVTINPHERLFDYHRSRFDANLRRAASRLRLSGKISSHSMRKTFAQNVQEANGRNIYITQQALGHASIQSTVSYLSFDQGEVDAAILGQKYTKKDVAS